MQKLTESEKAVYNFIVTYFQENGFSPSLQEICNGVYYTSKQTVYQKLRQLQCKGYIELPLAACPRAIKVVNMKHIVEGLD